MNMSIIAKVTSVIVLFSLAPERVLAQTIYIGTNSVWKYSADGTDPGSSWILSGFPDGLWSTGVGKFGFGGDGERTAIGAATNGYTNFYFRYEFTVTGAAFVSTLRARFIRDDGLVVYLNGTEAFRDNMPGGIITPDTQASTAVSGAAENQFFTNSISPSFLVEGSNLIAVEVHQRHGATTFSSDLGFYLELLGDLPPEPPAVAVTNPSAGEFIQSRDVTLSATATDNDGYVTQVEFLLNNSSVGFNYSPPYSVIASNLPPGDYTVAAVATDSQGLRSTSAAVSITVVAPLPSLVPFGAVWRYLDDGSDQGTAWKYPGFPDYNWAIGPAELGYGDNDERTVVSFGPDPLNKFTTTYFRYTFDLPDPQAVSSLTLRLVRDDGVAVYLNGIEIARDNLMTNANYRTLASNTVEDVPIIVGPVDPSWLLPGPNVIAAEIHQATTTSSDISFDLNLITNAGFFAPLVRITAPANGANFSAPTNITISATALDPDGAVTSVQFFVDSVPVGAADTTVPYAATATNVPPGYHELTGIVLDNTGLTRTGSVWVTVGIAPCELHTNTFQQGLLAYAATVDTQISESARTTNASDFRTLTVLGTPGSRSQALLRFDGIFGPAPNQIPPGAVIESAQLQLRAIEAGSGSLDLVDLHQLLTPWLANVTWNTSFGTNGIQPNGQEAAAAPDNRRVPSQLIPSVTTFQIPRLTIQRWLDGVTPNFGWALLSSGNDDFRFESSESLQVSNRPALTVAYWQGSPPVIRTGPRDQNVALGGTIRFNVLALDGTPLTYQWRKNGIDLAQSTDSSLTISNAQPLNAGSYDVIVRHHCGSITSVVARCIVILPPTIIAQPVSQISPYFATVTFSVAATENPTYQWFRDHIAILHATNASLVLSNVQRPDAGVYDVTVNNLAGSANSLPAELQIELTQVGTVRPGVIATDNSADLDQLDGGGGGAGGGLAMIPLPAQTEPLSHGIPVFFNNINAPGGAVSNCNVRSSHTKWVGYTSRATGSIPVSTVGSDFDTVLAVYTNYNQVLVPVMCDRNSGTNRTSFLRFTAQAPKLYYIAIDGEGGQTGHVRLQVGDNILQSMRFNRAANTFAFEVKARPNIAVNLRRVGNLPSSFANWESVLTFQTNRDWVFWFTQSNATSPLMRFYGAVEP